MNDVGPPGIGFATPAAADVPRGATAERRLDLLRQISSAGGTITPRADPSAEHGYAYALSGDNVERDLAFLTARNYLATRFFDRVSLCPKCGSHHLNVREVCPSCRQAYLSASGLLHHFACGYVGIPSEFSPAEDGSYRCPKCNRRMHHLGTEYDRLGKAFVCRGCGVISENPPVEAVCLSCGVRNAAEDLVSVFVFSYLLTSRGAGAVRSGSIFTDDEEPVSIADAPVYRREVILEFAAHEMKRLQRFSEGFSVLLADCPAFLVPEHHVHSNAQWLTRLCGCLREIDLVGQLSESRYLVILPRTKRREADALRQQAMAQLGPQSPIHLSITEITGPQDLAQILAPHFSPGKRA